MRELNFASLGGLVAHLMTAHAQVARMEKRALDVAAGLIEKDAKDQIGHYQPAVADFPAWAPLAQETENEKARIGAPLGAPLLRTGLMYASISREVHEREAVAGCTDPTMVFHEFGTSKMPPRPVFGPAVENQRHKIQKALGHVLVDGILGGEVAAAGAYFGGDIKP